MPSRIELEIDELVLHGFAPTDRYRIGEAVQSELGRLFVERRTPGSLAHSEEIAHVDAGAFSVAPGSPPAAIGAQIARAVYGRLA